MGEGFRPGLVIYRPRNIYIYIYGPNRFICSDIYWNSKPNKCGLFGKYY